MWKKKMTLALLSLTMVLTIVLSGCSSNNESNPSGNQGSNGGSPNSKGEQIELTFAQRVVTDGAGLAEQAVWEKVVKGYTDKNPNVSIKLDMSAPKGDAWRTWLTTGLIGGTAPELVPTNFTWTHDDLRKDLLVDLTPYYDQPNPYNENKIWKETFSPAIIAGMQDPSSQQISGVSLQTVSVRVFYNIDLFKELNLEIPTTWEEFIAVQAEIKENGKTPFAFANSRPEDNFYMWVVNMMNNNINAEKALQFDLDGSGGSLTINESVGAVDQGKIDMTADTFNVFFPIIKDWSQYWAKGFNSISSDQAYDIFLRGDAAMVLGGNFNLKLINESEARKFEYGTFPLPPLTKNEVAESSGKVYELGGEPGSVLSIPKSIDPEKLETVVDFLMYLSSPEAALILGQELYYATTLVGVELPPQLSGFQFVGDKIVFDLFSGGISKSMKQNITLYGQLYLEGSTSLEDYMAEMQKTLKADFEDKMKTNNWNKDNDYGLKK